MSENEFKIDGLNFREISSHIREMYDVDLVLFQRYDDAMAIDDDAILMNSNFGLKIEKNNFYGYESKRTFFNFEKLDKWILNFERTKIKYAILSVNLRDTAQQYIREITYSSDVSCQGLVFTNKNWRAKSLEPKKINKIKKNKKSPDFRNKKSPLESFNYLVQTRKLMETFIMSDKNNLSYREKRIAQLRFSDAKTLEVIGNEFNVTRERIRQIVNKAIRKLRHPTQKSVFKSIIFNDKELSRFANGDIDVNGILRQIISGYNPVSQKLSDVDSDWRSKEIIDDISVLYNSRIFFSKKMKTGSQVKLYSYFALCFFKLILDGIHPATGRKLTHENSYWKSKEVYFDLKKLIYAHWV